MSTLSLLESVVEYILLYRPDIANGFNWDSVSAHSHISFAFIDSHPEYEWSHYYLSRNRSITWSTFTTNLQYDWDWFYLSNRICFKHRYDYQLSLLPKFSRHRFYNVRKY